MKRIAPALYIMMCASLAHGATLLFSDDFEGPNPLSTNYTGCTSGTTPIGNVTISTVQAHGGTKSAFYRADGSGAGHDQTAVCMGDLAGTTHHDFYISMWLHFTADFASEGHGWRIYPATGGTVAQFDGGPGPGANGFIDYDIDPIIDGNRAIMFNNALALPKAQWVRMEIEFHQGTGANDGTIRAWSTDNSGLHKWANPQMTGLHHDCDACSVDGCTGCYWTPQLALTRFALATNMNIGNGAGGWYTDDIEIWDSCPGSGNYTCVSGGGIDTTPPAAPRNVRVM